PTTVNATTRVLTAQTNHLSTFIVTQLNPAASLTSPVVFPNPLHINQGFMTFKNMPAGARVRIYTLKGELVFDQNANGSGLVEWPATNGAGAQVASGLYLAYIEAGGKTQTM